MKLSWLTPGLGLLPLFFTACATMAPPQPPSLELPKAPGDLHATRKGDGVVLTWTVPAVTTDRQTIRNPGPTRICRATAGELKQCGTPVGEAAQSTIPPATTAAKQKVTASYTDKLSGDVQSDSPSATATYAVEVFNQDGRGAGLSNQVRVPLVRTLPAPQDFQAKVTSQGVVLSWSGTVPPPHEDIRFADRVYRRIQGEPQWKLVGEVPVTGGHPPTFTDSEIEWEKTYEYRVDVATLISEAGKADVQVEGEDSPIATVMAHDIFPPAVPSGLQAVSSGPGQKLFIDLLWAPVADVDMAGYNVYRHEAGAAPAKINAELVRTPSYRDATVEPGKQYFYSASSVDARGNESQRSEEATERVP